MILTSSIHSTECSVDLLPRMTYEAYLCYNIKREITSSGTNFRAEFLQNQGGHRSQKGFRQKLSRLCPYTGIFFFDTAFSPFVVEKIRMGNPSEVVVWYLAPHELKTRHSSVGKTILHIWRRRQDAVASKSGSRAFLFFGHTCCAHVLMCVPENHPNSCLGPLKFDLRLGRY